MRGVSNVRLSLTYRIAMHYGVEIVRSALIPMLIISLAFSAAQALTIHSAVKRINAAAPDEPPAYSQQIIQLYTVTAVQVNTPEAEDGWQAFWQGVSRMWRRGPGYAVFLTATNEQTGRSVEVSVDLVPFYGRLLLMLAAVILADTLRIFYFLRHHRRLDKRVLAPIRDITEMAATLSASNLSNRINVAGTKNELQDLAVVINSMLDRIERSYNSQKQFVSDASHELRTPIAVIQGYADMLKRWGKEDPEVLDEGLTAIAQETAAMKALVENLLFLARHDKKTLMLEMSAFDPCDVLEEVRREAELVTPADHFRVEPLEHCQIEADRNMIKQVVRILLDNAVKYTPEGGTITMGARALPTGCQLRMMDTGCGIAEADLPKIFDRFYRADAARKSDTGGHGLGLSIARIIVVAHGGKIRVRSKPGEGTTFDVLLPYRQDRRNTERPVEEAPVRPVRHLRRRKKAASDSEAAELAVS